MTDVRLPLDQLEDRVIYVMDGEVFSFAVYSKDKETFFGVNKRAVEGEEDLEERSPYDPTRGHYGEVVPVEATDDAVPDWINLALTIDQGVWVPNRFLLDYLVEFEKGETEE